MENCFIPSHYTHESEFNKYNSYEHNHNHLNHHHHHQHINHRNSLDSGYESILLASSASFSNSFINSINLNNDSNSDSGSSIFSHPSTPIKTFKPGGSSTTACSFIYNGNNSSTTPDFKQQYVADVNGFYFASLRSAGCSPTKSNLNYETTNFSYSNFSSPSKLSNSPKLNPENFVHKRDTVTCKLLRSPAFKLDSNNTSFYSPNRHHPYQTIEPQLQQQQHRPIIKSFSSRFESNSLTSQSNTLQQVEVAAPSTETIIKSNNIITSNREQQTRTTPTEEEFMKLLIQNHHIPENPEFLIGRQMGLENVDILAELNKRSMVTIIDKIFSYLDVCDIVRMGCVSKEWRQLVKQDKKRNKHRIKFIKFKKKIFETSKENRIGQCDLTRIEEIELSNAVRKTSLSADEKRALFSKGYKSTLDEGSTLHKSSQQSCSLAFASFDLNCVNNLVVKSPNKPKLQRQNKLSFEEAALKLSPVKKDSRQSPMKKQNMSSSKIDLICSKKSKNNLKRL